MDPLLVTVPNVQLLEVGEDWMTSTGVFTFTTEDLASAVAAQDDPNIRTPVLKFGHTDPRFGADGDFAVGRIENMRLSPDGMTLFGDYVGVPLWLAKVIPSAYPRRSIEGEWRAMSRKDQPTWEGFHLTALALLGAYYPACATLEDFEVFWKGEDPPMYDSDTGEIVALSSVLAAADQEDPMPAGPVASNVRAERHTTVAAATQVDDVRRQWWETQATEFGSWAWIRAMYVDPPELIVDDDEGNLYRQPFTIDGDEITFGEGEQVRIEYVSAGRVAAGRRATQEAIATYATRDASAPATVAASTTIETQEVQQMLTDENIKALGLDPASATPEQINEALMARLVDAPAPGAGGEAGDGTVEPADTPDTPTAPTGVQVPEGMQLVDAAAWAEVQKGVAAGVAAAKKLAEDERRAFLSAAVRDGKFPRARLGHYEAMYEADPEGTRQTVASLAKGLVPVAEVGDGADSDGEADKAAYPDWMRPKAAAGRATISGESRQGALITNAQEG